MSEKIEKYDMCIENIIQKNSEILSKLPPSLARDILDDFIEKVYICRCICMYICMYIWIYV